MRFFVLLGGYYYQKYFRKEFDGRNDTASLFFVRLERLDNGVRQSSNGFSRGICAPKFVGSSIQIASKALENMIHDKSMRETWSRKCVDQGINLI